MQTIKRLNNMSELKNFIRMIAAVVFVCLTYLVSGQSIDEARNLYNEGGNAVQEGNLELGVQKFEECVQMCETLYQV